MAVVEPGGDLFLDRDLHGVLARCRGSSTSADLAVGTDGGGRVGPLDADGPADAGEPGRSARTDCAVVGPQAAGDQRDGRQQDAGPEQSRAHGPPQGDPTSTCGPGSRWRGSSGLLSLSRPSLPRLP